MAKPAQALVIARRLRTRKTGSSEVAGTSPVVEDMDVPFDTEGQTQQGVNRVVPGIRLR
ncbi:hypothetical protein GCM10022222_39800 [Amycolatopsis ultiminotia]|uniref:Uncharacterized protein n=1 Tax=Amycolatopsis ultiminotia TaxID=543629 RepID=A0ABP6WPU1_9PSEU